MRLTVLTLAFFLITPAVSAQRCELTLDQSPRLRGFRLGMTVAQARAKLPGVTIPAPNEKGGQTLFLKADALRKSDPSASADVRSGLVEFFDGRLVFVLVNYDDSVRWEGVDEFTFSVSQALGLPPVWARPASAENVPDYYEDYSAERVMMCSGFMVRATLSKIHRPPASISLIESEYPHLLAKRIREIEERKKARFKP